MLSRIVICCLVACTLGGIVFAEEGDYISIFTTGSSAGSDNVSIILANMDTVASTFEIENIGMEEGDVIVSTTVRSKHVQLYVIPHEWSHATGEEAIQLDIVTSSRTEEAARLTGQIELVQQPKVLIQLNDVFHTPGDYLTFRVILTDELNKPLPRTDHPFNLTIDLRHETQHTVASWNARLYPGDIYSSQHLFADDRDIGDWNMTVKIGEQITMKRFRVMLYTAPIHKITINTGEMNTFWQTDIEMSVEAMFMFGKPINGILTLTISGDADLIMQRTYTIAGRKEMDIPINQLFRKMNPSEARMVHINATVVTKNGLTQRSYQQTKTIQIYPSPYKLEVLRTVDFTPGQNATLLVKAMKANGKPLAELKLTNRKIYVSAKFDNDGFILTKQFETLLDNDHTAMLSIPTDGSTERLTVSVSYQDVATTLTLESAYSPQLYVYVGNSIHQKTRDGLELAVASSHPMDGVLVVIRKHAGENIPLFINCNLQNYHEHYVPSIRPRDVKRLYVFARFEETLVQTSTTYQEPDLDQQVRLSMDGTNIRVFTDGDDCRVGIAVYEGSLDETQLKTIYARSMFNGSVYPETADFFPLSINELKVMPSLQHSDSDNQPDGDSDISTSSPSNRLLLWNEGITRKQMARFRFHPFPHVNQVTVTAFAFSLTGGLGIAAPIQWHRQQDIEIYLHIPYSAKRMEAVTVDLYVVNNRDQSVDFVLLELLNKANEFHFLNNSGRTDAIEKTVYGRLQPYEVQRAEFLIRPKKLGSITLKANAYTEGDVIASAETILRTIPESVQQMDSIVRVFNVDNSTYRLDDIKIPIPPTVDVGSEKVTVSLHREQIQIAALPASILMDKLVQADPFTMAMKASLTLDVLALGRLHWSEREALAKTMANETVVDILAYAKTDGSFAIPAQHVPSSKCWDTVIAVQALAHASEHLSSAAITAAIVDALEWLKNRQATDGHFCTNDGEQTDLERIEKTAHVLLAYLGMRSSTWRYVTVIDKARTYLLSKLSTLREPYHLALVGHVLTFFLNPITGDEDLALINQSLAHILGELLDQKRQSPSGMKMWWNTTAAASDLETTAYVLLLMTTKKHLFDAAPIVNWIKGQPYRRATPSITPNSHIALRALIEYAKHTTFLEKQYTALITARDKTGEIVRHELQHGSSNRVVKLPSTTRSVNFSISGSISGAIEINYSYMESVTKQKQKFDIVLYRYETSNEDYTDWRICIRFLPHGFYDKTHMVTCEISFPTGYIALDDSVDELNQLEDIVATVLRNDETQLSITFEEIGLQQKCFNVTGFRQNVRTRQLPGTIKVFDLADASNVAFKQIGTTT
ncbi:thioester-containing protein 1 allele R1-like [Anopheles marshallii]|uniref:thioester-containing protein 1 allele R1-like n=1 Tax=Anopheles marshallii TaxID=1521116 RepID=UPI00237B3D26|nr:thioester-containing protein 1 allele R1-like [Anopheles marshallii]